MLRTYQPGMKQEAINIGPSPLERSSVYSCSGGHYQTELMLELLSSHESIWLHVTSVILLECTFQNLNDNSMNWLSFSLAL